MNNTIMSQATTIQYGAPWSEQLANCKYGFFANPIFKNVNTKTYIFKICTGNEKFIGKQIGIENVNIKRVEEQLKILSNIRSNAVLIPYEVFRDTKWLYQVLERFDGDARKYAFKCNNDGKMPLDTITHVGSEVLDGLQAIHALKVGHRDLKPTNIFMSWKKHTKPIVKIADLDMARQVSDIYDPLINSKTGNTAYIHTLMVLTRVFHNKDA
eukprot:263965_1